MSARMSLRDAGLANVFINEDLTKEQASLFYEARQARKSCSEIKSAWTENGSVYIRSEAQTRPLLIRAKEDLALFQSNVPNPPAHP